MPTLLEQANGDAEVRLRDLRHEQALAATAVRGALGEAAESNPVLDRSLSQRIHHEPGEAPVVPVVEGE